ncbi:secretion related GTPase C [Aspergillus luchuensis]|uniref:Secretion related GTPase C n=1 Tax=Aspergillus kawachii TaxID=1069201 RepID=A0A146FZB6_ASPKA|nr:secretion related GTPase C [Aspergillus luchuensis]
MASTSGVGSYSNPLKKFKYVPPTDLNDKREVTTAQGEEEAKKNGLMFIETSAKVGHNVKQLFRRIAQALPGMEGEANRGDNQMIDVNITPKETTTNDGCAC